MALRVHEGPKLNLRHWSVGAKMRGWRCPWKCPLTGLLFLVVGKLVGSAMVQRVYKGVMADCGWGSSSVHFTLLA